MDRIEIIIPLISSITVLFGAFTGFIISLIKTLKSKKDAVDKLTMVNFWIDMVKKMGETANMTNEEREKFILDKVDSFSKENKLQFDEEEVLKAISEITEFTKKI